MLSGKLPYPTRMPARAALLLKVLRTTRLSYCWTHLSLEGSSANSIYASSRTTRTGSCKMAFSWCSCMRLPSGLLGDVRKTIFGLYCSTAAVIPACHHSNCSRRQQFQAGTAGSCETQPTWNINAKVFFSGNCDNLRIIHSSVELVHSESWWGVQYAITRIKHTAHQQIYQLICPTTNLQGKP